MLLKAGKIPRKFKEVSPEYELIQESDFPDTGWLKIDSSKYSGAKTKFDGVEFVLLARKHDGIGLDRLQRSLVLTWSKWCQKFPIKTPTITIVDADLQMGSGALRSFGIGVYLGYGNFEKAQTDYIRTVCGWDPHPNATAYIEHYYSEFEDPIQAYVNDHTNHALGHIFFLNGVTEISQSMDSIAPDTWFSLGIGMVYDNLIWHQLFDKTSPRLQGFVKTYESHFSTRTDIDQRLICPDTSGDEGAGLTPMLRLQIYGHAKSFVFLNEMRLRIGPAIFDGYVQKYLARPIGSPASYQNFLKYFSESDLQIVNRLEIDLLVK